MLSARYFPATGAAKAIAAQIALTDRGDALTVQIDADTPPFSIALTDLDISERFSRATRSVYLPDGSMLEVDDGLALSKLLGESVRRDSWVTRLQHSWRAVLISLVASVLLALIAYRWGLPVAADQLSQRVPATWTAALDRAVLAQFKTMGGLEASALSPTEQARLRAKFDALVESEATRASLPEASALAKPTIYFHKMGSVPNAFALPGGSIVFFDGLVSLAGDDDALLGVFAHEYGHVIHRHGLRNLLRTAVISAVAAWYFGDFTALANAAILVSQLSYSRAFETEADETALRLLRVNGIKTQPLAALFRKMRDFEKAPAATNSSDAVSDAAKTEQKRPSRFAIPEFLSTHPDIDSRIERFEREAAK